VSEQVDIYDQLYRKKIESSMETYLEDRCGDL